MELVLLDEAGIERPKHRKLLTFRWTDEGAVPVAPEDARVAFQPGELLHQAGCEDSVLVPAEATDPYLVMLYGTGSARPLHLPSPAVTAGGTHIAVAKASIGAGPLAPYTCANRSDNAPRDVQQPVSPILTGNGGGLWIAQPHVQSYVLSQQSGGAPRATTWPVPTVATAGAIALAAPSLGQSQYLVSVNHGDGPSGNNSRRIHSLCDPLGGMTTSRGVALLDPIVRAARQVEGYTAAFFGSNVGRRNAAATLAAPLRAVTTRSRYGFCLPSISAYLVPQFGERPGQPPRLHALEHPAPAVTSHGAGALVVPLIVRFDNAGARGVGVRGVTDPLWAITGKTGCALAESYIICPRHSRIGGGPAPRHSELPVPTLTGGGSQFGVVSANAGSQLTLLPAGPEERDLGLTPARVTPPAGRIVWVDGVLIQIDVAFRMLRNRELARAHSFDDEEQQYEFVGTETAITRQLGNSVPVETAKALVLSQILRIPGVQRHTDMRPNRLRSRSSARNDYAFSEAA